MHTHTLPPPPPYTHEHTADVLLVIYVSSDPFSFSHHPEHLFRIAAFLFHPISNSSDPNFLLLLPPYILAWRIPWTEEPGRLQSTGSQSPTWLKRLSTHAPPYNKSHLLRFLFVFTVRLQIPWRWGILSVFFMDVSQVSCLTHGRCTVNTAGWISEWTMLIREWCVSDLSHSLLNSNLLENLNTFSAVWFFSFPTFFRIMRNGISSQMQYGNDLMILME